MTLPLYWKNASISYTFLFESCLQAEWPILGSAFCMRLYYSRLSVSDDDISKRVLESGMVIEARR